MQVILHNDDTVHGFDSAQSYAEEQLKAHIKGKLYDALTRVEVWISDQNGPKGGPDNKKCSMEAHPSGRKPVGVHATAEDVPGAIREAAKKLAHALEREIKPGHPKK